MLSYRPTAFTTVYLHCGKALSSHLYKPLSSDLSTTKHALGKQLDIGYHKLLEFIFNLSVSHAQPSLYNCTWTVLLPQSVVTIAP